ncbi:integration host factor, actinobacterial type [Streptomyces sp. NPDC001691]|uniref:integration host factor, actinobacterial type n=1 Tax=unclassified Streptomyces TaxID=2593676 RepID=UPI000DE88C46|nr:integration host factor, actinobacterial type [Streptomyces sp. SDr-06]RCH64020.1 integration host factor [Streptomyces sp. SDr-06]
MGSMPPLSPEQRQAALDKAAAARTERANVKSALKRGTLSLHDIFASTSEAVRKMPVRALLESLPDIGKVRAQKILTEMDIAENRRVRGLGTLQKQRLLELLTPRTG